jgi:hypothetical protein
VRLSQSALALEDIQNVVGRMQEGVHKIELLIGHIAQCRNDAIGDEAVLEELKEGEAFQVEDYKMKLLQAWFREDTTRWFGKAGISCHGTMWQFLCPDDDDGDDDAKAAAVVAAQVEAVARAAAVPGGAGGETKH